MRAAPPSQTAAPRRADFPVPVLIGFSLGMIGDRIFRDAPALLLRIFMTDYLAVPPALAGAAVFIPKLLIMFVDPLVGTLSDRLHTRWGGRIPLMSPWLRARLAPLDFTSKASSSFFKKNQKTFAS